MSTEQFEAQLLKLIESITNPRIRLEREKLLETQQYLALLSYRQVRIFIINITLTSILLILGILNLVK